MFPAFTAMNTFFAAILVFSALQFGVILPVTGNESSYPLIKTTACPGAAYTFGYHGFTYVPDEFTPVIPQRTYVPKVNKHSYVYRLREQLTVGQAVTIRGIITEGNEYAAINLLSKTPIYDVDVGATALHMSIRPVYKKCHFNSIDKQWGQGFDKPLNLSYNEEFEVVIRALNDGFKILINGEHLADFPYRIPLEIIDTVSVQYNAIVTELRVGGRHFNNINKIDFPGGHLKLNERVIIEGYTFVDVFDINLLDANGLRALEISAHLDEKYVSRNSETSSNVWEREEFGGEVPFSKNRDFALELTNRAHGIEIVVNRKHFATFNHRIDKPNDGYKAISFSNVAITGLEVCTSSCY